MKCYLNKINVNFTVMTTYTKKFILKLNLQHHYLYYTHDFVNILL